MDEELEGLMTRWEEARRAIEDWEKRLDKIRDKVKKHVETRHLEGYENDHFTLRRVVQNRSQISKDLCPPEIWERYATPRRVEFWSLVTKKNKK